MQERDDSFVLIDGHTFKQRAFISGIEPAVYLAQCHIRQALSYTLLIGRMDILYICHAI